MQARGMIASGDAQTSEAGAELLRAGGNAVDAVLAAAFASMVCEQPLTSPAGAGVLLFGTADLAPTVLDFFATAPGLGLEKSAWNDLDFYGATVDFGPTTQVFHVGRGAAAVPTAMFGLLEAHRVGGHLPLTEIVAPAIHLARKGYTLSPTVAWVNRLLEPIVTMTPGMRSLYCLGDTLAPDGAQLTNPRLADFFEAVARDGEAMLRGPFVDAVLASFGPAEGGLLTRADFGACAPVRRQPLRVPCHDFDVLTNPPPASGGALIALGLRIAEGMGFEKMEFLSAEHVLGVAAVLEVVSEARRGGFVESLNQPSEVDHLLGEGRVDGFRKRAREVLTERSLGSTTHISVLDTNGGAASLTMSNGESCGHVLPEFGIQMNNFLGEEDINPGGFHRIAPGQRMTTMMSPTIVVSEHTPRLVLGSGGSNRIRTAIFQGLLNAIAFRRSLDESMNAPRIHVEGDHLWFEAYGLEPEVKAALARAWPRHARFDEPNMFFGGVHSVGLTSEGLKGGGDRRRGGTVASAE